MALTPAGLSEHTFASQTLLSWWFQLCFLMFIPNLGEMIQFDLHIFFRWFNHLVDIYLHTFTIKDPHLPLQGNHRSPCRFLHGSSLSQCRGVSLRDANSIKGEGGMGISHQGRPVVGFWAKNVRILALLGNVNMSMDFGCLYATGGLGST